MIDERNTLLLSTLFTVGYTHALARWSCDHAELIGRGGQRGRDLLPLPLLRLTNRISCKLHGSRVHSDHGTWTIYKHSRRTENGHIEKNSHFTLTQD